MSTPPTLLVGYCTSHRKTEHLACCYTDAEWSNVLIAFQKRHAKCGQFCMTLPDPVGVPGVPKPLPCKSHVPVGGLFSAQPTTEGFFKVSVAIPFLDNLRQQLTQRFTNSDLARDGLLLVPANIVEHYPNGCISAPEGIKCLATLWEENLENINLVEAEFTSGTGRMPRRIQLFLVHWQRPSRNVKWPPSRICINCCTSSWLCQSQQPSVRDPWADCAPSRPICTQQWGQTGSMGWHWCGCTTGITRSMSWLLWTHLPRGFAGRWHSWPKVFWMRKILTMNWIGLRVCLWAPMLKIDNYVSDA